MSAKRVEVRHEPSSPTKADLILKTDLEISARLNEVSQQVKETKIQLDAVMVRLDRNAQIKQQPAYGGAIPATQLEQILSAVREECSAIRREINYLAAQNESIYEELSAKIDNVAAEVASRPVVTESAAAENAVSEYVAPAPVTVTAVAPEIDYDLLARKVAELIPAQEYISPDYIACKVAEQIVVPEAKVVYSAPEYVAPVEPVRTEEKLETVETAQTVSEPVQETFEDLPPVQEPAVVEKIVERYVSAPVDVQIDEEELADRIALKLGALRAEDFDIIVDDDGCASISREIVEKLDYDIISAAVAEKLRAALDLAGNRETDYEEMAQQLSEKITVSAINEEAIADKAAAALSNYLPEIDPDDIADKVASQLIQAMPAVDNESIVNGVSEKLIEQQSANDYDIVIDEEGLDTITNYVTTEVLNNNKDRFDNIDNEIAEIKALLESGAVIREVEKEAAPQEDYEEYVTEESTTLVTVSDIVESEPEEEVTEETSEETEETDPNYQSAEPESEEFVIDEIVEDIDEQPAEGEIMPDGAGGVDFLNMMKYNRSFIARIIQGSDEQKQYYGQVKNALLSYKKVNSNVAWGAERFHKGRETIARFKIRGKTLCLYLALDPAEYKESVYHHVDVSDNKSMHGTPMMVKIRSPLYARKAIRLVDEMLAKRDGIKRNNAPERDYAKMYPYETMEELIEDGLVKDVSKNK